MDPRNYFAETNLKDGRRVRIRAIMPEDREILATEFSKLKTQDRYQRFFFVKTHLSHEELTFLTELDFVKHVALVAAVVQDGEVQPAGVGRFIVQENALGKAEIAFTVVGRFQGLGIAAVLFEHLRLIAVHLDIHTFTAQVLSANHTMLEFFTRIGLPVRVETADGVSNLEMDLI